jgi:hypothetical protein
MTPTRTEALEQVAAAAREFRDATTAINDEILSDRALWGRRYNLSAALRQLDALNAPKEGK